MAQTLMLGIGSGWSGEEVLVNILRRQPNTNVTFQEPPMLPWNKSPDLPGIRERLARIRRSRSQRLVGDVGSFYLPYIEEAIALEPAIRIVCLKRPLEES